MSSTDSNRNGSQALVPVDDERTARAEHIIGRYALYGTGAGILPYAELNIAALTTIQTRMIRELAALYGVDFSEHLVRVVLQNIVVSAAGQAVAAGVTRLIESFGPLRYVLGGMTSAALSGALTAAIGQVYHQHFARGGTLADIDLEDIVRYIRERIEYGEFQPGNFGGLWGRLKYLRKPD
jgi:uncharacterized protein (DUF697 family)